MKRVCLVDVDSKMPNLALMKASTWHKQRGDDVKLGYDPLFDHPDLCYVSKIFDFTPEPEYLPECETYFGGPGYSLTARMPFDDGTGFYDRIMPDYDLYKDRYPAFKSALGRFTRGCPNRCPWCVVWHLDGNNVRKVASLKDFWCGQETVRLLDDNVMSDEAIFDDVCDEIRRAGVRAKFDALDIRCVNDRTAAALASIKHDGRLHFAWDGKHEDAYIVDGITRLKEAGINPGRLMFYVLVGFNTSREYDMQRIMALHELGANPYVMPYDRSDPYQKHLARWCNNKFIFRKTTFENYEPWARHCFNQCSLDTGVNFDQ